MLNYTPDLKKKKKLAMKFNLLMNLQSLITLILCVKF